MKTVLDQYPTLFRLLARLCCIYNIANGEAAHSWKILQHATFCAISCNAIFNINILQRAQCVRNHVKKSQTMKNHVERTGILFLGVFYQYGAPEFARELHHKRSPKLL